MFSIRQIRAQARQTLNVTPGIFYLPIIPVVMSLAMALFQYFSPAANLASSYDPMTSSSSLISSLAFPILYNLLVSFITISVSWTILLVVRGVKKMTDAKDAITIFNSPHLGKIFRTFLLKEFYLFLWGLVAVIGYSLLLGGALVGIFYAAYSSDSLSLPEEVLATVAGFIIIGLILAIAGTILLVPQYMAYSQVEYILFDQLESNQYDGANAIIKASRQLMKGYKGKRFLLDLSFIGWFILMTISFGLAGLYVLPYYHGARAHFYEAIQQDIHMKQAAFFQPVETEQGATAEQAVDTSIEEG